MEVIDILTIIGYTITVFSLGYALGKDYAKKQKRPPLASQTLTVVTYNNFSIFAADRLSAVVCFSIIIISNITQKSKYAIIKIKISVKLAAAYCKNC